MQNLPLLQKRKILQQQKVLIFKCMYMKTFIFRFLFLLFFIGSLSYVSFGQSWRRQPRIVPRDEARYKLATGYHRRGLYKEALEVYRDLQQQKETIADTLLLRRIAECEYAIQKTSDPEPVTIVKLDSIVNSAGHANFSAFALDGERSLYFTSSRFSSEMQGNQPNTLSPKASELLDRVCVAHRETLTSSWQVRMLIDEQNSQFHEGVLSVSPDGRYLFIFRGNNEIFVQDIQQLAQGVKFVPLDQVFNLKISNKHHVSSLAMANNGQTIFLCISDGRYESQKGYGGYDIWCVTRNPVTGVWSEPANMGAVINTAGNEVSVSALPDGKTIFFASDGLKGMGGYDIYRSVYVDSLKTWSNPVHLGYPINTPNNDVYYNPVFDNPRHAYYSVGKPDVADGYDIYFVSYYGEILSEVEKERRRLEFVRVLKNVNVKPLKPKDAKRLARKKYTTLSEKTPAAVGVKMILREVQFAENSSKILSKAYPSLDALCCWLNLHTGLKIRIAGYTDNKGKKAANIKLSRARAQNVANYLIKKGIAPERIVVKGYGRKLPVASNKTAEGRAFNRRVEMRVIAK
jgi:outer membrane protein OmpA-like peptidoglycan-associated protein